MKIERYDIFGFNTLFVYVENLREKKQWCCLTLLMVITFVPLQATVASLVKDLIQPPASGMHNYTSYDFVHVNALFLY